ncbi:MAG: radical SAM protein [Myxococcota bacterium]
MKALIKVGYACNDHCGFCHTLHVRHIDGSADEVHRKIERAKELGHSMVVLSGGEPTIRPELTEWAAHVASLDMDFGLVTNGRMLAYPDVVETLLKHRLRYVYLSLHGGSAKVHNLMVRSQAFEETYGALANLTGRGIDLHVNCVITRHNMDHLRPLVDSVLPYEDASVKFSMVEPKGGGDVLFRNLMPRVSDVAKRVADALAYAREKTAGRPGPRFAHGAIPLCLLPGEESGFDDLKTHQYWTMIEVGESDFFPVDDLNKVHPARCEGCALKGPCPGLYRGYHETFGDEELKPVREGVRSNSFNYTLERVVRSDLPCPLRDGALGITPWDRGRHLIVRNGERVGIYRAPTRDFSDAEIAALKHDVGQVYVDASRGKPAPDDFARDLVKLQRAGECAGCEHQATCSGLFEPVFEDVFSRDDQVVRALLGSLEGDVLDIGCGEGPYGDLLGERVQAGALRYVGIDPDARAIRGLTKRWPWADLHCATAEDFDPGQQFDHVFILRSWNHLFDPAGSLARVREWLRPGGWLTVVDNVAFGLARTAAHTSRAERSSAELEHHRNDDSVQARKVVEDAGFEVVQEIAVGPETSNQWLLRGRPVDERGS